MTTEEIKQVWDERAKTEPSAATTYDLHLRELEAQVLIREIKKHFTIPRIIVDCGCGDGKTTLRLAKAFPESFIVGTDYSQPMLDLAEKAKASTGQSNCVFRYGDILTDSYGASGDVDVVTTTRVLINLPSPKDQYKALLAMLCGGHVFIGIENFVDEQILFEKAREAAGLHRILVHSHNLFLEEEELRIFAGTRKLQVQSFANAYYYATRILYAKMCQMDNVRPDYDHEIHRVAVSLPEISSPAIAPMKLFTLIRESAGDQPPVETNVFDDVERLEDMG